LPAIAGFLTVLPNMGCGEPTPRSRGADGFAGMCSRWRSSPPMYVREEVSPIGSKLRPLRLGGGGGTSRSWRWLLLAAWSVHRSCPARRLPEIESPKPVLLDVVASTSPDLRQEESAKEEPMHRPRKDKISHRRKTPRAMESVTSSVAEYLSGTTSTASNRWGMLTVAVCLVSLAISAHWLTRIHDIGVVGVTMGQDAKVYCDATSQLKANTNPYLPSAGFLPFVYPPAFLLGFRLACGSPFNFSRYYIIFDCLLLLASVALWVWAVPNNKLPRWKQVLVTFTFASAGFLGFHWNLLTGNVGVAETFLLALGYYLLARRRDLLGAITLGVLASIKLLTLGLLAVFLVVPISLKARARLLVVGLVSFLAVFVLSGIVYPELMAPYLQTVFGQSPGRLSLMGEMATIYNPSLYALGSFVIAGLGVTISAWLPYALLFALSVAAGLLVVRRSRSQEMDPILRRLIRVNAIWLLAMLMLPRMKQYTFILPTLPLAALALQSSFRFRLATLVSATLLPILAILPAMPFLVRGFSQTLSFLIAGGLAITGILVATPSRTATSLAQAADGPANPCAAPSCPPGAGKK